MGPSPTGDGERVIFVHVFSCEAASMGPSPTGDGEACRRVRRWSEFRSFNGAVANRRRRDDCDLDWSRRAPGFNGAVANRRRRGGKHARHTPTRGGFNGAVANRRRRAGHHGGRKARAAQASMGPSPTGDGESRSMARKCQPPSCFNGAVANRRRRGGCSRAVYRKTIRLQWGRRQQATERSSGQRRD